MITTIYSDPTTYTVIHIDENTELVQKLLGEDFIRIRQTYETVFDFNLGDYYPWNGTTYYVNQKPTIKKISSRQYDHEIVLEAIQYDLAKVQFLSATSDSDFYLTGQLGDFIDLIVTNMNRVFSGWAKGTVDATFKDIYKTLHFQGSSCMSVLQTLCSEYDAEFTITGRTIGMTDSVGVASGLSFTFGKGGGLRDIERTSESHQGCITRLYAFGSDKNLGSNYRSGKTRLEFSTGGQKYVQSNTTTYGTIEYTKIFDDIFPSFTGSIATVPTSTYLQFSDKTIDFNLNDHLLPGISPKIHFQDGDLAGYEFEVAKFNNTLNSVTFLEYTDQWTKVMPNSTLHAATGDHYTILDITMPTAYISEAETLLLNAATAFLHDHDEPIVQVKITPDWKYCKTNAINLSVGDTITVTDTDLSVSKTTRIVGLTRKISAPYKYTIEIGEEIQTDLIQDVYSGLSESQNKENVSKLGDVPTERWGWWVTNGPNTGRTWATNSGLPGSYQRIIIDGKNNNLRFYKSTNTLVVQIDDNVYSSLPGVKVYDGVVNVYNDVYQQSIISTNGIQNLNEEVLDKITTCVQGDYANQADSTYGQTRYGVWGRCVNILTADNNDNLIGVYGKASTSGSGTVLAGHFEDAPVLIDIDDATANATTYCLRLLHTTSGTPDNNIGSGIKFEVETSAGNNEIIATIEAINTDKTATDEDGAIVFKTMSGGSAAAEVARFNSVGLQIGTTAAPTYRLEVVRATDDLLRLTTTRNTTNTSIFNMYANRGAANVANGDRSQFYWSHDTTGGSTMSCSLEAVVIDATSTSGLALAFSAGGLGVGYERMRILNNGYVGIGTTSPVSQLNVKGATGVIIQNSSDTTGQLASLFFKVEAGEDDSNIRTKGAVLFERTGTYGVGHLHLCNDTAGDNGPVALTDKKFTVMDDGNSIFAASMNVGLNGITLFGTSAAGVMCIKNGTAPTTAYPADSAGFYAADDTGVSHIYTWDEAGNKTKLGQHNDLGEWEFYSENKNTGKKIRVNMEKFIRAMEDHTGETFIENR